MFLHCGERPAPDEGFGASLSEHSPEGCVSQDGCRLFSWGCIRVPRAVVQSRVPAVPQGLCAGAGTLPPARLSTQLYRMDSMPRNRRCPTAAPSASSSSWRWQTRGSCSSCTSGSSVACDHRLHTPMYFFLLNLALLDLGCISTTLPKAMANALWHTRAISYTGCAAQVFFFLFLFGAEYSLLIVMSYDRYVAICKPLHYGTLMDSRACATMAAAAWGTGLLYSLMHTATIFSLPLCQGNAVDQFFCEIPHILKLSCSDAYLREIWVLGVSACLASGCFAFILFSCVQIFRAVLRMPSEQGRHKAFSTCLPHLAVVSLFLNTAIFANLRPLSLSSQSLNLAMAVLYSVVPPTLNPLIYSMRNQELKDAVRKVISWTHFSRDKLLICLCK
uniref:Olfactory receptor n=1 Tax=Gallus gallus TaxID=9031 RepID=A0A8V0X2T0_CHICK